MTFGRAFLDKLRLLRRVEQIYRRYCREGKRPSREEAYAWLLAEGWNHEQAENLLREWGYSGS